MVVRPMNRGALNKERDQVAKATRALNNQGKGGSWERNWSQDLREMRKYKEICQENHQLRKDRDDLEEKVKKEEQRAAQKAEECAHLAQQIGRLKGEIEEASSRERALRHTFENDKVKLANELQQQHAMKLQAAIAAEKAECEKRLASALTFQKRQEMDLLKEKEKDLTEKQARVQEAVVLIFIHM